MNYLARFGYLQRVFSVKKYLVQNLYLIELFLDTNHIARYELAFSSMKILEFYCNKKLQMYYYQSFVLFSFIDIYFDEKQQKTLWRLKNLLEIYLEIKWLVDNCSFLTISLMTQCILHLGRGTSL